MSVSSSKEILQKVDKGLKKIKQSANRKWLNREVMVGGLSGRPAWRR